MPPHHSPISRRSVLASITCTGALAPIFSSSALPWVPLADARVSSCAAEGGDEIDRIARLLEQTPREKVIEEVAHRVKNGLSYPHLLGGLMVAAVRTIEPRPQVGFKFHGVLVINSAHLASMAGPASDRWLPIFWAVDHYKASQARNEREGNWHMSPVDEAAVPAPHQARQALIDALQRWDESAADAAAAAMARHAGTNELFDLLFHYGCRDFRSIGHKAIFVANSYRTLQVMGPAHTESIARSLVYALLNHTGEPNPATNDLKPDRAWRQNQSLADKLRPDWTAGTNDAATVQALLDATRTADDLQCAAMFAERINAGASAQAAWDAIFQSAGEAILAQPGIVAIHAVTTANALHVAYQTAANPLTRKLAMLQAASFLPLFREALSNRGAVANVRLDQVQPKPASVEAIFDTLGTNHAEATAAALGYLREGGSARALIDHARRLVFTKGNDPHDYKYNSALLEDYDHISAPYRDLYLAAGVGQLNHSREPDNALVQRIREVLS